MIACHLHDPAAEPPPDTCGRCGGDLERPAPMRFEILELRDAARERLARPAPTTPGDVHVRMLTDPRDQTIADLAELLLERMRVE